jgi:hypothetical protein
MSVGLVLVMSCAMCAGEGAPSDNVSSLSVTGNSITLTIPVNIVNVEPAVLADWQRSIDRAWNHGNDGGSFSHCGKPVIFEARRPSFGDVAPGDRQQREAGRAVRKQRLAYPGDVAVLLPAHGLLGQQHGRRDQRS